MPTPFPGMDPYLEHPSLWPDVHNSLISAIREAIAPALAPKYFVRLEQRIYADEPGELGLIGRADAAILADPARDRGPVGGGGGVGVALAEPAVDVLEVEVPVDEPAANREWFLRVHEASNRVLVAVIELLSPSNKKPGKGRELYEAKRHEILASATHLVEIDLLRDGRPMPVQGPPVRHPYRILISREERRPAARLYSFGLRGPIPAVPIPLLGADPEPTLDLNAVLHALYERARFDLQIVYDAPAQPPLAEADAAWARELPGLRR